MCIVIDVNTVHSVFNPDCANHVHFKAVLDWIVTGRGKIVCGGTRYFEELAKLQKYIRVINLLKSAGKVVLVNDADVDRKAEELKKICADNDFDDPHIVALLIVSGCKLVCSQDARSYPYLRKAEWYPAAAARPKIYCSRSSRRAGSILADKNIASICLPCERLKKEKADQLLKGAAHR